MHLYDVLLDTDWGQSYAPEKVALAQAFDLKGGSMFTYFNQQVSFAMDLGHLRF